MYEKAFLYFCNKSLNLTSTKISWVRLAVIYKAHTKFELNWMHRLDVTLSTHIHAHTYTHAYTNTRIYASMHHRKKSIYDFWNSQKVYICQNFKVWSFSWLQNFSYIVFRRKVRRKNHRNLSPLFKYNECKKVVMDASFSTTLHNLTKGHVTYSPLQLDRKMANRRKNL